MQPEICGVGALASVGTVGGCRAARIARLAPGLVTHFGNQSAARISGDTGGAQVVAQSIIQYATHPEGAAGIVFGDDAVCDLVVRAHVQGGICAIHNGLYHLAIAIVNKGCHRNIVFLDFRQTVFRIVAQRKSVAADAARDLAAVGIMQIAVAARTGDSVLVVVESVVGVSDTGLGLQVAGGWIVAVGFRIRRGAIGGVGGNQSIQGIIAKSLRFSRERIRDALDVANVVIGIGQILQRGGGGAGAGFDGLQTPALGVPGIVVVVALRAVTKGADVHAPGGI